MYSIEYRALLLTYTRIYVDATLSDVEWEDEPSTAPIATTTTSSSTRKRLMDDSENGFRPSPNYPSQHGPLLTHLGSVPYSLEITIPTTAEEIVNDENAIIIDNMREIANQLIDHKLPMLSDYINLLSDGMHAVNLINSSSTSDGIASKSSSRGGKEPLDIAELVSYKARIEALVDTIYRLVHGQYKELLLCQSNSKKKFKI